MVSPKTRLALWEEGTRSLTDSISTGAATGATLGGFVGAGVGILEAIGLIAVPGIGVLVAGGALASILAGVSAGAITGGVAGALLQHGVSEEYAHSYAEGISRGGTLVSVNVTETSANEVESVMEKHNPIDIRERAKLHRHSNWTDAHQESAASANQTQARKDEDLAPPIRHA